MGAAAGQAGAPRSAAAVTMAAPEPPLRSHRQRRGELRVPRQAGARKIKVVLARREARANLLRACGEGGAVAAQAGGRRAPAAAGSGAGAGPAHPLPQFIYAAPVAVAAVAPQKLFLGFAQAMGGGGQAGGGPSPRPQGQDQRRGSQRPHGWAQGAWVIGQGGADWGGHGDAPANVVLADGTFWPAAPARAGRRGACKRLPQSLHPLQDRLAARGRPPPRCWGRSRAALPRAAQASGSGSARPTRPSP